jgi:hypothetical protein
MYSIFRLATSVVIHITAAADDQSLSFYKIVHSCCDTPLLTSVPVKALSLQACYCQSWAMNASNNAQYNVLGSSTSCLCCTVVTVCVQVHHA